MDVSIYALMIVGIRGRVSGRLLSAHLDGLWDISELHMLMHISIVSLAFSSR